METVNKKALVDAVSEKTGFTKKDVTAVVESVFETIGASLSEGNTVDVAGFGKFVVKERAARKGVNPATGATIEIAASRVPTFKASRTLKSIIK